MTILYVADEHHRLHWLWRDQGARGLALSHVDFHCDLRGLLIDRPAQRAVFHRPKECDRIDQGNFLMHAVRDGRVASIDWLHDAVGGRRYDYGTVAYESDLAVRLRPAPDGCLSTPLRFRERIFPADWAGPNEGEHLNLDWDALNCRIYTPAHARRLQRWFLERPFPYKPDAIYFIASWCSSRRDRGAFEAYVEALARRFDATVERLSPLPPEHSTVDEHPPWSQRARAWLVSPVKRPQLWLSSRLKAIDTARDLAFPYAKGPLGPSAWRRPSEDRLVAR